MADSDRHTYVPQSNDDVIGSRYALEVAFHTMKERCQRLQQRLAKVEDENIKLRIHQKKEEKTEGQRDNEVDVLREKVSLLERQKHQLVHHIHMVTSENKQLWNRVSQAAKMNQSLGNKLSKITDTLNRSSLDTNINMSQFCGNSNSYEITGINNSQLSSTLKGALSAETNSSDIKIDSLEEISLKLIHSFLQEKSELEDQCAQMSEMRDGAHSPSFNADHFDLLNLSSCATNGSSKDEGDNIGSMSVSEMQQLRDCLLHIKQELLVQQDSIRSSIEQLCRIRDGGLVCHSCQQYKASEQASQMSTATTTRIESAMIAEPESFGDSADEEIKQELHRISENSFSGDHIHPLPSNRICPMCGRFYSDHAPFEDFHRHVVSHFENDAFDSLHDNFVVVTPGEQV